MTAEFLPTQTKFRKFARAENWKYDSFMLFCVNMLLCYLDMHRACEWIFEIQISSHDFNLGQLRKLGQKKTLMLTLAIL